MDKKVAADLKAIIHLSEPILSRWEKAVDLLISNKMITKMMLLPTLVLCHPSNRAKLGLNPFEVHRVGVKVVKIGFSREELRGAVCIEISPDVQTSQSQVAFNFSLVDKSDGMLAPTTGEEKYLSLGGGHMAAFLRAVAAACKTCEPFMADESGVLNKHKLLQDPVLKECAEGDGYEWLVVSWKVEVAVPEFTDFAQRALNAANSIASECTELEVMSSMAEFAQMQEGKEIDWTQCQNAAISGSPRCAPYASTLMTFVKNYGGGRGAPVIHDLDAFAKQHAQNLILGEEFLETLIGLKLGETTPCPRFRAACVATNLTSKKSSDGVSKLLTKSDLNKFQSKETVVKVTDLEIEFKSAETLVKTLVEAEHMPTNVARDMVFLFMIRSVAHLTGKGLQTFMKKKYASQKEILDLFYEEVNRVIPSDHKQTPSGESSSAKPDPAAAPDCEGMALAQPSFDDMADPVHIARANNFKIDTAVYEKAMGSSVVYIITNIGEAVEIKKREIIPMGASQVGSVPIAQFIKGWGVFKGDLPTLIEPTAVVSHQIIGSNAVMIDEAKVGLFTAMLNYSQKGSAAKCIDMLHFCCNPTALFANKRIGENKLEIVPVVPLSSITVAATGSGIDSNNVISIDGQNLKMYIGKVSMLKTKDQKGASGATGYAHPFFWMIASQKAGSKKEANVAMCIVEHMGFKFPVFMNTKQLEAGDQLFFFDGVPSVKKSGVTLKDEVKDDRKPGEPKAKKAKK